MKSLRFILTSLLLLSLSAVGLAQPNWSYDFENMKKEDYFAELQKLQKREADAKAEMANLEARMNELQGQITAAEEAEQACRNEIYAMLGTDEAGYNAFVQQCRALESDLNAFVSLSGEEIYKRRDELESYRSRLAELSRIPATLLFFESPNRIASSLLAIASELGPDRRIAICRELTKLHEEVVEGTAAELAARYDGMSVKGEIVIVVAPPAIGEEAIDPRALLAELLTTMSVSRAASEAAKLTGIAKRDLYSQALELSQGRPSNDRE